MSLQQSKPIASALLSARMPSLPVERKGGGTSAIDRDGKYDQIDRRRGGTTTTTRTGGGWWCVPVLKASPLRYFAGDQSLRLVECLHLCNATEIRSSRVTMAIIVPGETAVNLPGLIEIEALETYTLLPPLSNRERVHISLGFYASTAGRYLVVCLTTRLVTLRYRCDCSPSVSLTFHWIFIEPDRSRFRFLHYGRSEHGIYGAAFPDNFR